MYSCKQQPTAPTMAWSLASLPAIWTVPPARHVNCGPVVFVNERYAGSVETPFGGYGKSGYGREKGRKALWNYVQTKNIAIRLKG